MKIPPLAEMRKAVAALAGLVGEAVSLGLLHGSAEHWVTLIIGAATAVLVFATENARPPVTPV